MSPSGRLGTGRLCLLLFSSSSCRTTAAASVLCSCTSSLILLEPSVRSFASKPVAESERKASFTVSYLRNSCGLSLGSAEYVSKHVKFQSSERPDSVINLFKAEGFTVAQISKFIKWQPFLLLTDPKKCILPKFEFFRSMGCSNACVVAIFSKNPILLMTSLEKRIVPSYDIIKSVLAIDSKVFKCFLSDLSRCAFEPKVLAQNVQQMRDHGVPKSSIGFLLIHYISILLQKPSRFREILNEVEQMGFDPLKCYFVSAIRVLSTQTKLTVESKLDALEMSGLSKDEAWTLFKKQPLVVVFSKEKIMNVMDFLLNQTCWKVEDIVRIPQVFLYSLEKRTIPRCFVAHVLLSKGLEKEIKLSTLLGRSEELFLKRYVTNYHEAVPQLLDLYKGKISLADF